MPHLDHADRVTRLTAAELAERDRDENEARIREQVEGPPKRGCKSCGDPYAAINADGKCDLCERDASQVSRGCQSCGDPYAAINADGKCDLCERDAWIDWAKSKLGPEEIYPEREVDDDE